MAKVDITIEICGMSGEGTISAGEIMARCMSDQGYGIMSFDSYPAEIRGFGKCVAHLRIRDRDVLSPGKMANILISLNDPHSIGQLQFLSNGGVVIYDNKPRGYIEEDQSIAGWLDPSMISYGIPILELAHKAAGSARGRNMVALGALSALFDVDPDAFKATVAKRYAKKKRIVIDSNINSFEEGYRWTRENIQKVDKLTFGKAKKRKGERVILSGNAAVAQAAIESGLVFYAGYPITPATKIMELLSKELPLKGGYMVQTEDEISAIGHVVGAGFAGKRAMTATSGPGLCLMAEFINLSIMAEVSSVVICSQRGGPSTGLPTKTEQSDLNMAVHGGTGDSPRVVLAPTSVDECYTCTSLALYLAEKYQTAVILLLDFFLSNSFKNITPPKAPPKYLLSGNVAPRKQDSKGYRRYKITEKGISPRALPGTPGFTYVSTGLEHTEGGKPAYDTLTHEAMTAKRYRKLRAVAAEVPKPVWYGDRDKVKVGVLSWGSTAGAAVEAAERAREEGIRAAALKTVLMSPLQMEEIEAFVAACEHVIVPELNHTGQFADLLEGRLGGRFVRMNLVTGKPFPAIDILDKIRELAG